MAEVAIYDSVTASDMTLAVEISAILAREYPGHLFYVHVNLHPSVGMAFIQHFSLSENEGFRLKIPDLAGPAQIKKAAIMAAGEILERFNVPRRAADLDQLRVMERKSRFN